MARRTFSGSLVTEWPATQAWPPLGLSSVVRMRIVVVLPAPFGPMKPKTLPSSMLKCKSLSAVRPL
jgi:hypothetical protein